jgi:uncharacterized protein (DUF2336 family)
MPHSSPAQPAPTGSPGSVSSRVDAAAPADQSLINELEDAIAKRAIGRRVDILRRVTDLFTSGSDNFDGEQLALFDEVMSRLVEEIESSCLATFGQQLAAMPNAPPKVSRMLALDDSIEVAGPLLSQSEQLDEETIVTSARTKSQEHLLAISRRRSLTESVTDVLVERGNREVVVSTAANVGAKFSEFGCSTLVGRSENDEELALQVWSRPEIPRQHLLTLFTAASESVRLKLETADRTKTSLVRDMVKQAADRIQTKARDRSPEYRAAFARLRLMHEAGGLTEAQLLAFARTGSFDETAIALSLMCDLPINLVERAIIHEHSDQVLVLAKAIGLSWETAKAMLLVRVAAKGGKAPALEQCHASFKKLQPETARTVIRFHRLRERSAKPIPDR